MHKFRVLPSYAVTQVLRATPAVTAVVGANIYEGFLPDSFSTLKVVPKSVVVDDNGGSAELHAPIIRPDLLVRCYGGNAPEAWQTAQVVCPVLQSLDGQAVEPAPNRIVSCRVTELPQLRRDPDTGWWFYLVNVTLALTNI